MSEVTDNVVPINAPCELEVTLDLSVKQRDSLRQHQLAERGLLVSTTMGRFAGAKTDKSATADYAAVHGVSGKSVRVNKSLFTEGAMTAITTPYNQAREYSNKVLLPWKQGTGFIPVGLYQEYLATMRGYFTQIDAAVEDFILEWPNLLKQAKVDLGAKLFDVNDYPTVEEFRKAWHHNIVTEQVPSTDIRAEMNDAAAKDLEQQIARCVAENAAKAWGACANQLAESVRHAANILCDEGDPTPKKNGKPTKRKAAVHDTLLENLRIQVDVAKSMAKVVGDMELLALAEAVERDLLRHSGDKIRANPELRKLLGKKASTLAESAEVEAVANETKVDSLFDELSAFSS